MVDGFDLGKFWAVYRLHDRPHIRQLLEEYMIGLNEKEKGKRKEKKKKKVKILTSYSSPGALSPEDMAKISEETVFEDNYGEDPSRDKGS